MLSLFKWEKIHEWKICIFSVANRHRLVKNLKIQILAWFQQCRYSNFQDFAFDTFSRYRPQEWLIQLWWNFWGSLGSRSSPTWDHTRFYSRYFSSQFLLHKTPEDVKKFELFFRLTSSTLVFETKNDNIFTTTADWTEFYIEIV